MSERKPGWYWVKTRRAHLGKWEAALLDENKLWYLAGCDQPLSYTWPLEIGPRIPSPDESCRPENCRNELQSKGKPYPKSGCSVCGNGGFSGCPYERNR